MSISRAFAYNPTQSVISGVDNYGKVATPNGYLNFNTYSSSLTWWNGPDETNRYIIAYADSSISRNGANGRTASIWFRSSPKTLTDFVTLANSISSSSFMNWYSATDWLSVNGYWTNFDRVVADGGLYDGELCLQSGLQDLYTSVLLGSASLVMIPSGYKESVLFSKKPLPVYGAELTVNGTFSADTDWTKGTGWTIANNIASKTPGVASTIIETLNKVVTGKRYRITFTVLNYVAGSIANDGNATPISRAANGTYIEEYISKNTTIGFSADNTFNGSISNVSVKEYTSGDMDVVRSTIGTRVNSSGTVEFAPSNLFKSSENLTSSDWLAINANKYINYFTEDSTNGIHILLQTYNIPMMNSASLTVKCRLKAKGRTKVELRNNAGGGGTCYFDLSNGTKYSADSLCVSTITQSVIGNGYYDITYTYLNTGDLGFNVHFRLKDAAGSDSYVGDGVSGIYMDKLQLSTTEAANYINITNGLNVPRIDYSTGVCPSLLSEAPRTNLILRSNGFDTSPWLLFGGAGVTANQGVSPNGANNFFKLTSAGGVNDFLYQPITTTSSSEYSVSFYMKNVDSLKSSCWEISTSVGVDINWNGLLITSITAKGSSSNINYKLFNSDTWLISYTYKNSTTDIIRIYPDALNTSKSILIANFQLEVGPFPSSYIPTTTAAVTRNGDNIKLTRTLSANSTVYCKAYLNTGTLTDATSYIIFDIRTSQTNRISLYRYNNVFYMDVFNVSVQFSGSIKVISSPIKNSIYKFVTAISSNTINIYLNGSQIYTISNISVPTLTDAIIAYGNVSGVAQWGGNLGEFLVYDYVLTHEECTLLSSTSFATYSLLAANLNYTKL